MRFKQFIAISPFVFASRAVAQDCFRAWQIVGDERGRVMSMSAHGGELERLFVGGLTLSRPSVSQHSIAIWDGSTWSSATGAASQGTFVIREFEWNGVPTLFAGGTGGLYWWDGATFIQIPGNFSSVTALSYFDDGTGPAIYLLRTNGRIYRWSGSGSPTQIALTSPSGWFPNAMEVFDDGSGTALYVGGYFNSVARPDGSDPVAVSKVARWNGIAWAPVGIGMSGASGGGPSEALVECFAVWNDGSGSALYAGGAFEFADGNPVSSIARWNGAGWQPIGSATSEQAEVTSISILDRGDGPALYASGSLSNFAGLGTGRVVKWDGVAWSLPPFTGADNASAVNYLIERAGSDGDSELYAGGRFRDPLGVQVSAVARWNCICPDLDADGSVGLQDLSYLLASFGNTELATFAGGDINADGSVDLTDLGGLLSHFGNDCP